MLSGYIKMNQSELQDFVLTNPKLVTMRESIRYPGLFVLKYAKRVFYDALWNDFLELCRGTIVDSNFNVISLPFTKIYNFRVEEKSPVIADDIMVSAHKKVNGFMVAATWHNGEMVVSTTGSLDSPFVDMARSLMTERYAQICESYSQYTFLFECVHSEDPHIVPETAGMYLLGYREKTWESSVQTELNDWFTGLFKSHPVESFQVTVGELMDMAKTAKHEGFVFYASDGRAAKIKTKYYLTQKLLARKRDITSLNMELVDEEYYPLITAARAEGERFTNLDEQARLVWCRNYLKTI
jgi:ATP-dependent RNA circularization protein (DNA/RNA ligase family)